MLTTAELKTWLHRELSQQDKLLLILASKGTTCKVREIKSIAASAGLRIPNYWNLSAVLKRTRGLAIRTPEGWEITDSGKQHLRNMGVTKLGPAAVQVAVDLRTELPNIANKDTRTFVEEAIKCYEAELYRSAVVMSWLAAVHVLHNYVHSNHLRAFNSEARRIDKNWRPARTTDDIGRMNESEFLERICSMSVIGKNLKKELKDCLDRRNGCGHPNTLKVGANTVAHHIEILLLNVFKVF